MQLRPSQAAASPGPAHNASAPEALTPALLSLNIASSDAYKGYRMSLISAAEIGAVLALIPPPQSFADLDEQVAKGLPKGALRASIEHVLTTPAERTQLLHAIIPPATYKRRKERLSAEESGRAERLARIFATAAHVWNSEDDARAFLNTPHARLEGQTPLAVSLSEIGCRRVEALLWQIFYGLPV